MSATSKLLDDHIILVTGGGSGIGRATSLTLAADGAVIVVADLNGESAAETATEITASGGRASSAGADVTDANAMAELVAGIVREHGRLDGAFNNAGIEGPTAKVLDLSPEDWDQVIRVNLTGVFNCVKAEVAQMRLQDSGGSIVSTASLAGLVGLPGASAYVAAKHGVVGLTKAVALEYARHNIRANAVCPGFIDTPMLGRAVLRERENSEVTARVRDQLVGSIPQRRIASPDEIADAVAWLLSPRSRYTTGIALPVDGGWVAQ